MTMPSSRDTKVDSRMHPPLFTWRGAGARGIREDRPGEAGILRVNLAF